MSRSDDTIEETRAQGSVDRRHMLGMLRRMTLRVTSTGFWQVAGALLSDGVTREARLAEVFSGIGFYSRPKPGANAESVVGFVGGAENPCIIATREEDTRKRVAAIDQDETATFNTKAILHITKAGKVLAYLAGHVADAVGLAKASELNDLRAFVAAQFTDAGHVHGVSGASTNSTAPVGVPPSTDYPGTSVLNGQ